MLTEANDCRKTNSRALQLCRFFLEKVSRSHARRPVLILKRHVTSELFRRLVQEGKKSLENLGSFSRFVRRKFRFFRTRSVPRRLQKFRVLDVYQDSTDGFFVFMFAVLVFNAFAIGANWTVITFSMMHVAFLLRNYTNRCSTFSLRSDELWKLKPIQMSVFWTRGNRAVPE